MDRLQTASSKQSLRGHPVRGELLRSLRLARGWTQERAAKAADVSDRLIRKAEAGGPLEARTLALLAAIYTSAAHPVTPGDLLAESSQVAAMSQAPSADLLSRWLDDIWNRGRLDIVAELTTDDLSFHCETGVLRSAAELQARIRNFRTAFSDIRLRSYDGSATPETVACRWRMTMIHTGDWRGIRATRRRLSIWGTTLLRLEADRIVQGWEYLDPQLFCRDTTAESATGQ